MNIFENTHIECVAMVSDFFGGDLDKIKDWFSSDNPQLGYLSPIEMMNSGNADRLLKWIYEQLEKNEFIP